MMLVRKLSLSSIFIFILPLHARWDVKNHTWQTTEALRPLVVELDFQREGKTVFKSVNFAGYIGVLTGIKPQHFTLVLKQRGKKMTFFHNVIYLVAHMHTQSLDERFSLDGGFVGIIRWLMGDRTASWAGFLMREVLDQAPGYPEALATLATTKLLAPVYFILGGNASEQVISIQISLSFRVGVADIAELLGTLLQGAIITRGRNYADTWFLGRGSISQTATWYLIETNYDHWQMPPFYDDRRTPAIHCLDATGNRNASLPALFDVLSTRPVLNKVLIHLNNC